MSRSALGLPLGREGRKCGVNHTLVVDRAATAAKLGLRLL
jgi:hypothetical protein